MAKARQCTVYEENKRKFWKEIKRARKSYYKTEETLKDENGRILKGGEARKRWAKYLEELLNVEEERCRHSGSRRC